MLFYLLTMTLIFSSCAKMGYLTEQTIGQISIEWRGEDNEKYLQDSNFNSNYKRKIKKIEEFKKFFFKYFEREENDIYSETTILDTKAVTYLVIASKKDEIKPIKVSFPIVGEFPYLGFFNKKSAIQYKKQLELQGLSTYMRPVYAYSTLNKLPFYDNILSSFFIYNDQDLAELIFHELTHTVFFAKNEVDFNESFAEYIGRELSYQYFKYSKNELRQITKQGKIKQKILELISTKSKELNSVYNKEKKRSTELSTQQTKLILSNFIQKKFKPQIKQICNDMKVQNCWPLQTPWNNAKFAAFMTYTKDQKIIENIHAKKNLNLKDFFKHIEKRYEEFKKTKEDSFVEYLQRKEAL